MASPRQRSRSPRSTAPNELKGLRAVVVNLDRRPDRWERCEKMFKQETPWLRYERFSASDGSKMSIPEEEVCVTWNTRKNAQYADYDEWVFEAPGEALHGTHWRWADSVPEEDKEWTFDAGDDDDSATVRKIATGEVFKVKKVFAERFRSPGLDMRLSGGERGCAHSHRRVWELVARQDHPVLVLEDDAQFIFTRSDAELGEYNGELLKARLSQAMAEAPSDFDVLYLGWSGHRGGNFKLLDEEDTGKFIKRVEYVWTTVAYVLSPSGAKKLLHVGSPVDQPVDNFMAWEASQGRLKSFVVLDDGDSDDLWTGGIVDQLDFQGDSDIQKSDGGVQGDDYTKFAVSEATINKEVAATCGA